MADAVVEPLRAAVGVFERRAAASVQLAALVPGTRTVGGFDGRAVVTVAFAVYPPFEAAVGGDVSGPAVAVEATLFVVPGLRLVSNLRSITYMVGAGAFCCVRVAL